MLVDGLAKGSPKDLDRFLDGLVSAPHRHPAAFVWLAERAAVDEAMRTRNALRMLQQILTTLSRDEFAPFRTADGQEGFGVAEHGNVRQLY